MLVVLAWYLVVQIAGAAAFRLASPCFGSLADRGYGVSKTLGVLLLGLLLWLGTALGLLRNDVGGALLVAGGLVVAAAATRRPRWPGRRLLAASEVAFGVAFFGWCLVRALTPDVAHTEQPMDLMMLTAMSVSPTFPPADPWLGGYPVGYYYLGYWLMNAVAWLAGTVPEVAYNVGQACWLALLVTGCVSLGVNLGAGAGQAADRPRIPLVIGVLVALTVAGTANLHTVVDWLRAAASDTTPALTLGDYWPSSRVVFDTSLTGQPVELITEFPFFSYLLGDNHPHLLAMPFVVLALVCALSLLGEVRPSRALVLLAFTVVGTLVALNTWDVPAALLVLGVVVLGPVLARRSWHDARARAGLAASAIALVALALVPYFAAAQSQLRGVLPNLFHPTPIGAFLTMFGALVPGIVLLLVVAWREERPTIRRVLQRVVTTLAGCAVCLSLSAAWAVGTTRGRGWLDEAAGGLAAPLGIALARWATGWPVLVVSVVGVVVAGSLVEARWRSAEARPAGVTFALVLAATGLLLVVAPELFYLRDVFGNRMNTVFKSYYQAWLYLGAAGSVGVVLAWRHGGALRVGSTLAAAVLSTGLIYPVVATRLVLDAGRRTAPTLDGLAYLERDTPGMRAAISWVRSHTPPSARIAQAPGDSYRPGDGLLSAATGRPALLGWVGHEQQWRGAAFDAMTEGRQEALGRIYQPASAGELRDTLAYWRVDLVLIGPAERARYTITPDHEARLAEVLTLAFDQGRVRLYRRRG